MGHLCVEIESSLAPSSLFPDLESCWITQKESLSPLANLFDLETMRSLVIKGFSLLPEELLAFFCDEEMEGSPKKALCRQGNRYYLQRCWLEESRCIGRLLALARATPTVAVNEAVFQGQLKLLEENGSLLPEQAQAIRLATSSSVTFISGGPGTGKTYTAGELIKIIWNSLPEAKRPFYQIALAAPTGKAAMNLQQSLHRATADVEGLQTIKAKTLHSLLDIRPPAIGFSRAEAKRLAADLIIVDECSMIDVNMMTALLSAVKPGAQLILLGDEHQLPPISSGSAFSDALKAFTSMQSKENKVATVSLKKCLRTELESIINFAISINKGESAKALKQLKSRDSQNGIVHSSLLIKEQTSEEGSQSQESTKKMQQYLLKYAKPYFSFGDIDFSDSSAVGKLLHQFRILTPFRQGPFGVDTLNTLFLKYMLESAKSRAYFIAPIMLTTNDWHRNLFNGEMGLLIRHYQQEETASSFSTKDFGLFPSFGSEGIALRRIPALGLPRFEYAYAMSVHKSQGSEFDHILFLLPRGSELFSREVLYTGATRAKKRLEIWAEESTIAKTIAQEGKRKSGIVQRLTHRVQA